MRAWGGLAVLAAVIALAWWASERLGADAPPSTEPTMTAPTPSAQPTASVRPTPSPRPTPSAQPTSAVTPPATPGRVPRPGNAFAMKVTYVYDGDTIQAAVVKPNKIVTTDKPIRIRLIGVNAPEAKPPAECWGPEATAWLRAKLPIGTRIWAAPDRDSWDDYGRRLFNVWTDTQFIDLQLARLGQARALRVWPNDTHYKRILAAEQSAAAEKRGLWGTCATG